MKSLFLRIFLSFWLAIALFVMLTILAVVVFRPQRNPTWTSLATTSLADAVGIYEQGGAQRLRGYLENLELTQRVHVHIFDEQGNEISGRHAPAWIEHLALGKPLPPRDGILIPSPRVVVESRASSDGHHRYTIALVLPPGPRVFFGQLRPLPDRQLLRRLPQEQDLPELLLRPVREEQEDRLLLANPGQIEQVRVLMQEESSIGVGRQEVVGVHRRHAVRQHQLPQPLAIGDEQLRGNPRATHGLGGSHSISFFGRAG